MENIVYEKDYAEEFQEHWMESTLVYRNAVVEIGKEIGAFEKLKSEMQKLPRYIVPEDKANYEYLLPRLDALARNLGGKIRAEINYEKWDSSITLILPFLEFCDQAGYALMRDIAEKSDALNVTATEDGKVRVHVSIDYFDEIGIDSDGKRAIFFSELEGQPDLLELLEEYRREELKYELELQTGVPSALMNDDMVWLIGYAKNLTNAEIDNLVNNYFAGCAGDRAMLLKRVRELRNEVESET